MCICLYCLSSGYSYSELQSVNIIFEFLDHRDSHWLDVSVVVRLEVCWLFHFCIAELLELVKSVSDDVLRMIVKHVSLSRSVVFESSEAKDALQGTAAWWLVHFYTVVDNLINQPV